VIGADVREPLQLAEAKVVGVEDVVQRVAEDRVVGVEAVEEAAPHPRVQQPAQPQEELAHRRPGHVVQVARHHRGHVAGGADGAAHQHQLRVARGGVLVAQRLGRARVQAVERHAAAARQLQHGVHRGDVVLHHVLDLRVHQRQAREEHHPVVVLLRLVDDVRVLLHQRLQRARPPLVRLHRQHHVRVRVADDLQEPLVLLVLHQHVGDEEPDGGAPLGAPLARPERAPLHLHPVQRRVGKDLAELHRDRRAHRP
jgi:hypothetical protein